MMRAKWYICIAAAWAGGWIQIGEMWLASVMELGEVCAEVLVIGSKDAGSNCLQVESILFNVSPASMYPEISPSFGVAANWTHLAAMYKMRVAN